jgi:hypothetical protein
MRPPVLGKLTRAVPWQGPPSSLPAVPGLIAWDTETMRFHPDDCPGGKAVSVVSVAFREDADQPVRKAAFAFAQGRYGKPEGTSVGKAGTLSLFELDTLESDLEVNLPESEWVALLRWLSVQGSGHACHNAKFDNGHLRAGVMHRRSHEHPDYRGGWAGIDLIDRLAIDTAATARDLWPHHSAKLKGPGSLSWALWGFESDEQAGLKKHLGSAKDARYDLVPWDVMRIYADTDAELTLYLAEFELQALEEGCLDRADFNRELAVIKGLYRIEQAGVPYDPEQSRAIASKLEWRIDQAQLNLPYPREDAAKYYFDKDYPGGLGLEPYAVTEKLGRPQFTADILDQMDKDGVKFAAELAAITKAETAASMWYRGYADKTTPDQRLRTVFRYGMNDQGDDAGTRSGRFSVGRVNLQAIPHDYRLTGSLLEGLPTPRKVIGAAAAKLAGWELWELDLAQAELRVAALWAGCKPMLQMITEGRDAHGETAEALFGVTKASPDWGAMRQVAKRGNFSLIFGSGWVTFKDMVRRECGINLEPGEAKRIVYGWRDLYPEFGRKIEADSRWVERNRWIDLVLNRRRWFSSMEYTHKAWNQRVQGSLAELAKSWMVETDAYLHGELDLQRRGLADGVGMGGLLMLIHDSQVLLLPSDQAEEISANVVAIGTRIWDQLFEGVPGAIDCKRWSA